MVAEPPLCSPSVQGYDPCRDAQQDTAAGGPPVLPLQERGEVRLISASQIRMIMGGGLLPVWEGFQ